MAITPYLRNLTPKYQLMLYLIADGRSLDEIRSMTADSLVSYLNDRADWPAIIKDVGYALAEGRGGSDRAFTSPSGRPYSTRNLLDLLQRAHTQAGVPFQGKEAFVAAAHKDDALNHQ